MHIDQIALIGAGGHAKVVIDALLKRDFLRSAIRVFDQAPGQAGRSIFGIVVERYEVALLSGMAFHICIGNNNARRTLFNELTASGGMPVSVVHTSAVLGEGAVIGEGCFLAAHAVIGPDAVLGPASIVNHGAVVDHDSKVGAFCHVAPGSTLAGNVSIGEGVLVGAGANILPGVSIGKASVIGAGAVVTRDVPGEAVYVGVPARSI